LVRLREARSSLEVEQPQHAGDHGALGDIVVVHCRNGHARVTRAQSDEDRSLGGVESALQDGFKLSLGRLEARSGAARSIAGFPGFGRVDVPSIPLNWIGQKVACNVARFA
jgi:hypothetical protein